MAEENRYLHLIRQDCPLPAGTHVVAYCRDSGGEEQDRSVAQQAETIREYCHHHNLIIDKIYIDEARVSSNTDKRAELQEMLFILRKNRPRINDRYKREKVATEDPFGVIFWKSNRLGRDSIEATNIKTDLRLRGITIVDLLTSANTGNPGIDALIEAFQSWQDEQLLDEISQNSKRGLAQLVATRDDDPEFLRYNPDFKSTGGYLGLRPGPAPKGFESIPIQIGVYRRKKGKITGEARIVQRIVPDPDSWDRCYLAWKMRHEGERIGRIHEATRLYRTTGSYGAFFKNLLYTGDFEYGGKLYKDFVPALIPREWYEEEQKRRAAREEKRKGKRIPRHLEPARVGSDYMLSGLVYCGAVDDEIHPMHIETIPAKKGKRGKYVYFICTTKKNTRNDHCQAGRISLKSLEQSVIDNVLEHILTLDTLQPLADEIAGMLTERSDDAGTRINAIEQELCELRKNLTNLLDAIERMGYTPHLQDRYNERQREEAELMTELATLEALYVEPDQIEFVTKDMLRDWIDHTRETLEGGDSILARHALRQFIAKIVVNDKTGTIYYTFPLDVEMSSFQKVGLMILTSNSCFPRLIA